MEQRQQQWIVSSLCSVLEYVIFYQIHFLRSILRRPHSDRIPEGVRKSSGGTGIVIPVKKVPQEQKIQESRGFLQELPT
jgi:hypothetical protein